MNPEYKYFLYSLSMVDEEEIGRIFEEGIINPNNSKKYNINDIMQKIDIPAGDVANRTKAASADIEANDIFVIRIPKYYLEPRIINGNLRQHPLPIWKRIERTEEHDAVSILPPELVYGVYDKQGNKFKLNPNCSPVFDPSGMQYDDSQIEYFEENSFPYWDLFAKERRTRPYDTLVDDDRRIHSWDKALEIYCGHFVSQLPRKKVG